MSITVEKHSAPAGSETLRFTPVAGHIGADVNGIDLRHRLTAQQVDVIRTALHRYKVLFFHDQQIEHADQIAFSARFGAVTPSHPYDDEAPQGFPEILAVDSRKYARRFGKVRYSYDNKWHTDVTALVNPPAATILRADIVPDHGGDTQWTNLAAAYRGLAEPLQRLADGLRAEHRFGGRHPQWAYDSSYAEKTRSNPIVTEHPVVRVHPVTGERALFVTPGFTARLVGLSPAQSDRLLDLFFDEVTNPAYTVRLRWRAGTVAFWDNRATAHLAPTDLDDVQTTRVLYRTTLEGEVPVGPDGLPSVSIAGAEFRGAESATT
ncbi:TauD/TfdA dioxygenase family protein [Mycobacterium sp. C31M]